MFSKYWLSADPKPNALYSSAHVVLTPTPRGEYGMSPWGRLAAEVLGVKLGALGHTLGNGSRDSTPSIGTPEPELVTTISYCLPDGETEAEKQASCPQL